MGHKAEQSVTSPSSNRAAQLDRRALIREMVLASGQVSIEQLTSRFSVSIMTAHRDLDQLADDGWLIRVRGGATVHPLALLDTTVRSRSTRMIREKEAIARAAVRHVEPNQVILLDDSTSSNAVARLLPTAQNLTVVSNFLPTINEVSTRGGIELIAAGGAYAPVYDGFFGMDTIASLSRLHGDLLFMSTSAIDGLQCCHKSQETVQVKLAFLEAAATKVLLADHSKFGQRALHRLVSVTDFDLVIVDEGIAPGILAELRDADVTVEVAPL